MEFKVNEEGRVLYLKETQLKCDVCGSKEILFYHEYLKKKICKANDCFKEMSKYIPLQETESTFMKIDNIITEE